MIIEIPGFTTIWKIFIKHCDKCIRDGSQFIICEDHQAIKSDLMALVSYDKMQEKDPEEHYSLCRSELSGEATIMMNFSKKELNDKLLNMTTFDNRRLLILKHSSQIEILRPKVSI